MNQSRSALSLGLGAGLLGVFCCIGPLIPLLLGFGGASLFLGLDAYRPWFLGAGAVMLVLASVLAVRRRRRCCAGIDRWRELRLVGFVLGSGMATYGLLFYGVVPALSRVAEEHVDKAFQATGTAGEPPSTSALQAAHDGQGSQEHAEAPLATATTVVRVSGMTCAGCALGVKQAFLGIPGVSVCKVSWQDGRTEIGYDPERVTLAQIIQAPLPDHYRIEAEPLPPSD